MIDRPRQWLTNGDTLLYPLGMRDRDAIDAELRRLAALRRSIREQGGELSSRQVDELLDERLGHPPEVPKTEAGEKKVLAGIMPYRRKGALRRLGLLSALPLSLVAVVTAVVLMFTTHDSKPAAEPTVDPPSSARPPLTAPTAQPPPLDIADKVFIGALKQEGVPVPSHEYVASHGHAVCDFLAEQPDFDEATRFVQRSSIWDATQSAEFAAGAIVSYCPQYEPTGSVELQQTFQNVLSDLQAIQGGLQGIEGGLQGIGDDLQGIAGDLPAIPGQP